MPHCAAKITVTDTVVQAGACIVARPKAAPWDTHSAHADVRLHGKQKGDVGGRCAVRVLHIHNWNVNPRSQFQNAMVSTAADVKRRQCNTFSLCVFAFGIPGYALAVG
jgi:hypothetical protein